MIFEKVNFVPKDQWSPLIYKTHFWNLVDKFEIYILQLHNFFHILGMMVKFFISWNYLSILYKTWNLKVQITKRQDVISYPHIHIDPDLLKSCHLNLWPLSRQRLHSILLFDINCNLVKALVKYVVMKRIFRREQDPIFKHFVERSAGVNRLKNLKGWGCLKISTGLVMNHAR